MKRIPLLLALAFPVWAGATPYSFSNMPTAADLSVGGVTPGQTVNDIHPDNNGMVVHLFRQGEGWNEGTEDAGCNWNNGTGNCSFDDARDCQIAGQFNTCDLEVLVNGTYLTTNPDSGQQACDSQLKTQVQSSVCTGLNLTGGAGGYTYCQPAAGGAWQEVSSGSCPAYDNLLDCPSEYLSQGQIEIGQGYCSQFNWPSSTQSLNNGPAYWCNGGNHSACSYDMAAQGGCTVSYDSPCHSNVQSVSVNWGDGTTSAATYEHNPSSNPNNPQNVPVFLDRHTYSSLPGGADGSYPITVTESIDGTESCATTYTYNDAVTWNLSYSGPGNTYDWSGTNQMSVSTPATGDNSAYGASIDFNPASGFSGATNIAGSVMVGYTGPGNSGISGSGFNLYPDSQPTGGGSQQSAYGNAISLDSTTGQFSGGPIYVGDAWGWFEFAVANGVVDITYNGAGIGSITATSTPYAHTACTWSNEHTRTQTLSVYVYQNTPPPIQGGQETASPTPATSAEGG